MSNPIAPCSRARAIISFLAISCYRSMFRAEPMTFARGMGSWPRRLIVSAIFYSQSDPAGFIWHHKITAGLSTATWSVVWPAARYPSKFASTCFATTTIFVVCPPCFEGNIPEKSSQGVSSLPCYFLISCDIVYQNGRGKNKCPSRRHEKK